MIEEIEKQLILHYFVRVDCDGFSAAFHSLENEILVENREIIKNLIRDSSNVLQLFARACHHGKCFQFQLKLM